MAHIAAHIIYKGRISPHGEEWARVMALIRQEPSRCHQFDVSDSKKPTIRGAGIGFETS